MCVYKKEIIRVGGTIVLSVDKSFELCENIWTISCAPENNQCHIWFFMGSHGPILHTPGSLPSHCQ